MFVKGLHSLVGALACLCQGVRFVWVPIQTPRCRSVVPTQPCLLSAIERWCGTTANVVQKHASCYMLSMGKKSQDVMVVVILVMVTLGMHCVDDRAATVLA